MSKFQIKVSTVTVPVALAALVCFVAAGCGSGTSANTAGGASSGSSAPTTHPAQLFPDDFKGACSGASQSQATSYDQTSATHKMLYFATYQDSLLDQTSQLPTDWTTAFTPKGNALAVVDLVGCATRTADKLVKTCGGYQDNGKDTKDTVLMHTATYDVSIREATTGKVLADTTKQATDGSCPTMASFDGTHQTVDQYADVPIEQLTAFFKKYEQPGPGGPVAASLCTRPTVRPGRMMPC